MATSKIEITFNDDLVINDLVVFEKFFDNGVLSSTDWEPVTEQWKSLRSAVNQVTTGTPTAIPGERSAINYMQSIMLDYGFTGSQLTRVDNVVTLLLSTFWSFRLATPDPNDGDVSIVITNFSGSIFNVNSVVYSAATTNPTCSHYKATITTTDTIDNYALNGAAVEDHDSDVLVLELLRAQPLSLVLNDETDQTFLLSYNISQVPGLFIGSSLNLIITNAPGGGTVIANVLVLIGTVIEYSLEAAGPWQTSNTFTGLAPADYTIYIRDAYGCVITESFTIDEFGSRSPYFLMPKANSIRFKNNIVWSDCANYKTDENTLSCESTAKLPHREIQRFQSCDIITTQFRSSFTENTAKVIDEDGNETAYLVALKSNNMGLKDSRDARKYNLGDGKTAIYFTSGNLYDFDTGTDTGNDYTLNGSLPEWAVPGTQMKIDSEWFIIEDILFNEEIVAEVIVYSSNYTGPDVAVISGSVYNRENYEEYEFTIDMVAFLNKNIQVVVDAVDDSFTDIQQISECINIKVRQEGTEEFTYKNTTNTDINYSYGIEHKLRLLVEKVSATPNDESETHLTDTDALLLTSEIHEGDTILFSPLTTEMMRKVVQMFAHDTVKRNGISYVKNGAVEVKGPLEDTNLYDVTANLIKGANVFNSNSGSGSNTFAGESLEIPGLVAHEGGLVKYSG